MTRLRVARCLILAAILSSLRCVLRPEAGWRANPQMVQRTSAPQPGFNYDEARVGNDNMTPHDWERFIDFAETLRVGLRRARRGVLS